MSAGKVILLIFGIIVLLVSIGLIIAGSGVLWANSALTDDEGYYTTKTLQIYKDSYAVVSEPAEVDLGSAWAWDWGRLVTFKVKASNNDSLKDVFLGVADEGALQGYLRDVEYDEVIDFEIDPDRLTYQNHPGSSEPAAPATSVIWSESAYGPGTQTLEWELESGTWVLVLMNGDGSAGIDMSVVVGAKVPWLLGVGIGLLVGGVVALGIGVLMVFFAVRRA